MNAAYLYLQLYKLFDGVTPLPADCGRLCGKICCDGESDSGMLLFPGEFEVYRLLEPSWLEIQKTDMTYEYNSKTYRVPIAMCSADCDRFERPLACRIFPLTPHLDKEGRLEIISDPRAKIICPISVDADKFDKHFVKNVHRAFSLLMKNERFKAFMRVYSKYLDDFFKF